MMVDIAIIVIVALFGLVGLQKGFVKSIVSLLGFIGALIIAYILLQPFVDLLDRLIKINTLLTSEINVFGQKINSDIAVKIVCFVVLYILLLIAVKIIDSILSGIFKLPVLNLFNRLFGLLFGFIKGVIFVCVVYMLMIVFMNDSSAIQSSKIMKGLAPINPVIIIFDTK